MAKKLFFALMTCCMVFATTAMTSCSDDDDDDDIYTYKVEYQNLVEGVDTENTLNSDEFMKIFLQEIGESSTTFKEDSDYDVLEDCMEAYTKLQGRATSFTGDLVVTNTDTGNMIAKISIVGNGANIEYL